MHEAGKGASNAIGLNSRTSYPFSTDTLRIARTMLGIYCDNTVRCVSYQIGFITNFCLDSVFSQFNIYIHSAAKIFF